MGEGIVGVFGGRGGDRIGDSARVVLARIELGCLELPGILVLLLD